MGRGHDGYGSIRGIILLEERRLPLKRPNHLRIMCGSRASLCSFKPNREAFQENSIAQDVLSADKGIPSGTPLEITKPTLHPPQKAV